MREHGAFEKETGESFEREEHRDAVPDDHVLCADGATLKNVKIETIKGGDNLKLQNVSKICVDKKQYKKVGNKAESYRF